jgi:alpha-beta hydrolase superfamily lysophospholipase
VIASTLNIIDQNDHDHSAATRDEWVTSADGIKSFVRSWTPEQPARAALVVCRGLNAHGEARAAKVKVQ